MVKWLQKLVEEQKDSSLSMEQAYEIMQEIDREHKEANQYIDPLDFEESDEMENDDTDETETEDGNETEAAEGLPCPHITGIKAIETGVRIWWVPVENSDGYYIYRKTATRDWKLLKKTRRQKGAFLDKTAKPNRRYEYTIEAFRDVGETRVFSIKEPIGVQIRTLKNR
jgi:hypothetical protein